MDVLSRLVSEKPVVIFSRSNCPSSYSVKTLFADFGVSPAVYELDEIAGGRDIEQALSRLGCSPAVPTVYIGGNLVGGVNDVMTHHLNRSLKPMLERAGGIWV